MRYDSAEHLKAWQADGTFPKIHEAIANVALTELTGRRVLDLGCSYGLLGARLRKWGVATEAVGIDVDENVIAAAQAAGVPVGFNHLRLERASFPEALAIVKAQHLDVVIARRIMPELFGKDLEAGKLFAHLLARAGVKEMIIEGRINTLSATNPLKSIDQEVEMVSVAYREKRRVGAISYLVAR